jgi:hypothetical protein
MKGILTSLILVQIVGLTNAQTNLFMENFGSSPGVFPPGWTSSNTTNGFAAVTTSASSGYPGASGSVNARFINTGTAGLTHTLTYSNSFSTLGFNNITVLWAARATATFSQPVIFSWSADGSSWQTVSYNQVPANATWAWVNAGIRISLPAAAGNIPNLHFRWSITVNNSGNYQVDDFSVQGMTIVLPVSLASFRATLINQEVKLDWTTTFEQNNIGFEVQRSADATNFLPVGFVSSGQIDGNSHDILYYHFTDRLQLVRYDRQFYRLRQIDADGKSWYSPVVRVDFEADQPGEMDLFPNPASAFIRVKIFAAEKQNSHLQICDASGRNILQKRNMLEAGINFIEVNISGLPFGYYWLYLKGERGVNEVKGFIKK